MRRRLPGKPPWGKRKRILLSRGEISDGCRALVGRGAVLGATPPTCMGECTARVRVKKLVSIGQVMKDQSSLSRVITTAEAAAAVRNGDCIRYTL